MLRTVGFGDNPTQSVSFNYYKAILSNVRSGVREQEQRQMQANQDYSTYLRGAEQNMSNVGRNVNTLA